MRHRRLHPVMREIQTLVPGTLRRFQDVTDERTPTYTYESPDASIYATRWPLSKQTIVGVKDIDSNRAQAVYWAALTAYAERLGRAYAGRLVLGPYKADYDTTGDPNALSLQNFKNLIQRRYSTDGANIGLFRVRMRDKRDTASVYLGVLGNTLREQLAQVAADYDTVFPGTNNLGPRAAARIVGVYDYTNVDATLQEAAKISAPLAAAQLVLGSFRHMII